MFPYSCGIGFYKIRPISPVRQLLVTDYFLQMSFGFSGEVIFRNICNNTVPGYTIGIHKVRRRHCNKQRQIEKNFSHKLFLNFKFLVPGIRLDISGIPVTLQQCFQKFIGTVTVRIVGFFKFDIG